VTVVLQDWVAALGWKQQSILLSGMRGPDVGNVPSIKSVNRWLRTISQHNADPSKDYMKKAPLPEPLDLCDELEFLPVHYVHHLADALAVVAYNHPSRDVALQAAAYHYRIAEELFHFVPEQPEVFALRHRDKPQGEDPLKERWEEAVESQEARFMDAVDALPRTSRQQAASAS
jgi:hypothetical protein